MPDEAELNLREQIARIETAGAALTGAVAGITLAVVKLVG
jgi:hypothetical protein